MKKVLAALVAMAMMFSTIVVFAGPVMAVNGEVIPPTIDDLNPVPDSFVSPLMSGGINVSASYSDDGSGIDQGAVSLKIDDEVVPFTVEASQVYTGVIFLDDGWHYATVSVSDNNGNVASETWWFYVDSVSPKVSIKYPTFSIFTRVSSTPTIRATISDNVDVAGFQVMIDAKAVSGVTWSQTGPGAYSISYKVPSTSALRAGYHTVTVIVTDLADNLGMGLVFFRV